jgi:hypothetical protein
MKRSAAVLLLLAAVGGCVSTDSGGLMIGNPPPACGGGYMSHVWNHADPSGAHTGACVACGVDRYQGPAGEPFAPRAPAAVEEPTGASFARDTIAKALPPDLIQQAGYNPGMMSGPEIMQTGGQMCGPNGCPPGGPGMGLPPAPGGAGGLVTGLHPPGAVAAVGALTGPVGGPAPNARTSVRFLSPSGMRITWFAPRADGRAGFLTEGLTAPGSYNFVQAAIYRLKISDLPNRAGVEYYPTLEVVPANAKTATFLAHSTVPVSFTEEDLEQVASGNFVVKVIYLPDPQYQDLAATGAEEVVSSRLEPGVDPIAEACRRGSILAVVRLGNINLELAHSPSLDQAGPYCPPVAAAPGMPGMPGAPGMMGAPNMPVSAGPGMLPPGMMPQGGMPTQLPVMQPGPMSKAPTSSTIQPVGWQPSPADLAEMAVRNAK